LGKLIFVGLGLGSKGISLEGLEVLRYADVAYVEYYTTPHEPTLLSELEKSAGRTMTVVDRGFVEDGTKILREARASVIALAAPGDPMIATTHTELMTRAAKQGIETRIIHAATVGSAAASASGLHFYKFSKPVTITRDSVGGPSQAYKVLHENLLAGAHTLLLLEYDVEGREGVTPSAAIAGLLASEENFKRGVVGENTFGLVLSRLGRPDQRLCAGTLADLRSMDFGEPPQCLVVPGSLHFSEAEAVETIFSIGRDSVRANSDGVRRTAQVLVPKYVAKARKALESVQRAVGPQYEEVVENAELYLKDAESFLANGEDELAMLSVGYAEGLLDSLGFAGVVKIEW
jgi:diphthine synthase